MDYLNVEEDLITNHRSIRINGQNQFASKAIVILRPTNQVSILREYSQKRDSPGSQTKQSLHHHRTYSSPFTSAALMPGV